MGTLAARRRAADQEMRLSMKIGSTPQQPARGGYQQTGADNRPEMARMAAVAPGDQTSANGGAGTSFAQRNGAPNQMASRAGKAAAAAPGGSQQVRFAPSAAPRKQACENPRPVPHRSPLVPPCSQNQRDANEGDGGHVKGPLHRTVTGQQQDFRSSASLERQPTLGPGMRGSVTFSDPACASSSSTSMQAADESVVASMASEEVKRLVRGARETALRSSVVKNCASPRLACRSPSRPVASTPGSVRAAEPLE